MKPRFNLFREYLAECFMYWAMCIAPNTKDGHAIKNRVANHAKEMLTKTEEKEAAPTEKHGIKLTTINDCNNCKRPPEFISGTVPINKGKGAFKVFELNCTSCENHAMNEDPEKAVNDWNEKTSHDKD